MLSKIFEKVSHWNTETKKKNLKTDDPKVIRNSIISFSKSRFAKALVPLALLLGTHTYFNYIHLEEFIDGTFGAYIKIFFVILFVSVVSLVLLGLPALLTWTTLSLHKEFINNRKRIKS